MGVGSSSNHAEGSTDGLVPSFATASTNSHFLQEMYILVLLLLFIRLDKTLARNLSRTVCSIPMNEVSNRAAY